MERTSRMDSKRNLVFNIAIAVIVLIYLVLRLSFPDTIEFGYDQPRLAYTVLDFLKNGNFLTLQSYSLASPWGNLSWGPILVLFNAIFLFLTVNPVNISYLMSIFNILSIIIVLFLGKEFFNRKTSVIAGLIFATHPWWVIFSRMIYQPTPIPTFVAFSLLFLFKSIKYPKSIWIFFLVLSWTVLIQSYLITISFIAISIFILIYETKLKLNYVYLFLSAIISLIFFIPSVIYYFNNQDMFYKFISFGGKFETNFSESIAGWYKTLVGNNFKWQLGYSYDAFILSSIALKISYIFNMFVFPLILIFSTYLLIKQKNKYVIYCAIFSILPIFTLPIIGVENVVPRYFLYVLPMFSLFFGAAIDALMSKFGNFVILIPILILVSWLLLIFQYYGFVAKYNYPNGFLSNWSDVPYSFLDKSIKWIVNDSTSKKYDSITISSDLNFPEEFRFNWSQRYYWEYILARNEELYGNVGHYMMYFSPPEENILNYKRFGPYVVYEKQ